LFNGPGAARVWAMDVVELMVRLFAEGGEAAYFGEVTDASGRHRPPGRPTDATALGGGAGA